MSLEDQREDINFNLVEDDEDQHSHTEELSVAVEHDQQSVAHCPFSYEMPESQKLSKDFREIIETTNQAKIDDKNHMYKSYKRSQSRIDDTLMLA